ncbi:MAG TPA: MFS transporter, partial [Mycobacterium sp.]|nr:MFS transporter [Mycobacterium sp.]
RHQTPSHRGIRGNPWWILVAVSIGVIMVGLDASVVAIANPRIAVDLRASLSDLQWITDAYMLALASLLIFGGKLGDRFGRRQAFFIGVIGFAATSVGIGLIGTVGGVIALRSLQGMFGALLMPSTLAIVRATFPPEKLNTAVGIWGGASGVSIAAGPIVGGVLVEHVSWQSVFYINAPIAVVVIDFFALFGAVFFLSLYLQNVLGFSPVETGVRTLPLSLTLMMTAPLSGFLTEKFGPRPAMVVGLVAVAAALFSLGFLRTDSGYQALWPAFVLLGAGIGLVLTASSDAIIGNAGIDDAGVAGGLQSTAVQLGGVLGTTILGSVLSSRVGSVLVDQLTRTGTPAPVAAKLTATKELVAQGVSPMIPGMPASVAHAVAQGSHSAFMVGLHTSMVVAAVAAAVDAVLAMFVRRGENSGRS